MGEPMNETADEKDRQSEQDRVRRKPKLQRAHSVIGEPVLAGTQALPVDTNLGPTSAGSIPASSTITGLSGQSKSVSGKGLQAEGVQIPNGPPKKRPRGRPKSITDMKTYKAEKQREYRAKWKGRE